MNKNLIATVVTLGLAGCAAPQPQSSMATEDLNVGIAKTCTASTADLSLGTTANATIEMSNDGWCAVRTKEKDGQPFLLGLLRARPQHGRVLIQKLGGETRIEYTAENRYVGADRFTVALRSKTANTPDVTIQIAVTATMGEGMSVPATPPPAPTRPAPATARATPAKR